LYEKSYKTPDTSLEVELKILLHDDLLLMSFIRF
jgi:hypothetical protein